MKKHPFYKMAITLVLTMALLVQFIPLESVFAAWTTPDNITINDSTGSGDVSYFVNLYGTPQETNLYYVAGMTDTIAYCIDAESSGPGGTAYAINDSAIDATFREGLGRIAQYGYPTNRWTTYGISASEAQYATQAAMHWWENAIFGGTEGWVRAGVANNGCPTNFAGTLSYADWLLSQAGNHTSPSLFVQVDPLPTAWSAGNPPTSTFSINKYDCDSWTVTLPAGVTCGGASTVSGTSNQSITVQLTDPVTFAASSKQVTAEGFSNRLAGQIHYYVAGGGYQNMVVYQQSIDAVGDPADALFPDANGTLSLYKQTQWSTGVYTAEVGAVFQIIDGAGTVVSTLTTDASGKASVSLMIGTYTIHQLSGPGYTVNAPDQAYTVSASSQTATFTNIVYTGQIAVNKTYAALTGTVVEAGAVFQIYPNGSSYDAAGTYQRDQIMTNGSGYDISKSLPYGTYTMVQTAAPVGSQINGTVWTFILGADGATFIIGDVDTANISNTPTYGKLQISKNMNRGYNIPESGAVFQVFSTAYASYAAAPAALRDTLTTNAAGTDLTKDLPYGNYRIHQTGMPAGTVAVADSVVTIGATNGATVQRDLVNTVYWGRVEINKTTAYAGNVKLEARAVFQIYNTSYASYAAAPAAEKATVTTNASGYALSKLLPYGSYRMTQTGAPIGAQLNTTEWTFNLGMDGTDYLNNDVDTQNIVDLPTFGKLEITKTSWRGTEAMEPGATFEVYSKEYTSYAAAPDEYKDMITSDANGIATTKDLPYGTYLIHQSVAPKGTIAKTDFARVIGKFGITQTEWIYNEVYWGRVEINKTTEYAGNVNPEEGAYFQIYIAAYPSYSETPIGERAIFATDASGHAISKLLPYGTYKMMQMVSPSGAQLNATVWTFELGIDGAVFGAQYGDVDTENIVDLPTFGQLEIKKTTNRGYSVEEAGASFEIYCTEYASFEAAPAEYKDTITTDVNGAAVTKLLPDGQYSVHQTGVPAGTKALADYTISLTFVHDSEVPVINNTDFIEGKTGNPYIDPNYDPATDPIIDPTPDPIDYSKDILHQDLVNETFWGDIQVLKYKGAPSSTSGVLTPEKDATFRIYPSEFATWGEALAALTPAQQAVLLDEITSDMGGVASTNHQLPYGEYTVEQIDTIANLTTFKVDSWQVFIGEADNQTYTYVRNNEIYEQYLAVVKTDIQTGKTVKIAGATFRILAADGVTALSDSNGVDLFVTDANGRIDIKGLALQVGNYYIQETKAPLGYVIDTEPKAFSVSITDHGSSIVTIDYGVDVRSILFPDIAQTCQLTVEKKGEMLTAATQVDAINADTAAQYSDEDGNDLSVYNFEYSLTGKPDAVFEVFVGETDIRDSDGLFRLYDVDGDGTDETALAAGTSLGTFTTEAVSQTDGSIRFLASLPGLPLDSVTGTAQYVLQEVKAPTGDLINPDKLTYDFTYTDQTITQIDQEQSITDARQKVQITVEKQKEAGTWNKETKSFDWPLVAAPEILFGLFAVNDILSPDSSVLVAADTLVDVLYTDASGIGTTMQDLPMGSYYVKELGGTPDVILDTATQFPVDIVPTANQTIPAVVFPLNKGAAIVNREITGTMEIYKEAADTKMPMTGVVFEVYDQKGNLVETVQTGFDGKVITSVLPYGRYTLVETKTNTGYILAESISFLIWTTPEEGSLYSAAKMTIVNQKLISTPVPTPSPTPALTGVLRAFREDLTKTGEQSDNKKTAGILLVIPAVFLIASLIRRRKRYLRSGK